MKTEWLLCVATWCPELIWIQHNTTMCLLPYIVHWYSNLQVLMQNHDYTFIESGFTKGRILKIFALCMCDIGECRWAGSGKKGLDTVVRWLSESSRFNIEAGPRQQCVDTNSRHGPSPAKFKVGNVLCFAGRQRERGPHWSIEARLALHCPA